MHLNILDNFKIYFRKCSELFARVKDKFYKDTKMKEKFFFNIEELEENFNSVKNNNKRIEFAFIWLHNTLYLIALAINVLWSSINTSLKNDRMYL